MHGFRRVLEWFVEWIIILATGWTLCQAEPVPDLVFVQIPTQAEPCLHDESMMFNPFVRYVDGMQIMRFSLDASNQRAVPLTPEFVSACDPAVSFDGKTLLFAGKKSVGESWQIWRMDCDGGNKTQITNRKGDCMMPLYVGALFHLDDTSPTEQFVFVSTDIGWINEYGVGPSSALYAARLDGSYTTRITYNLSCDFDPDVLPNGRIVYTSWRRFGLKTEMSDCLGLMAVSNDGTDGLPYYGTLNPPVIKGMAHVSAESGRVYLIESDVSHWLGGGDLSFVTMRRPLHSHSVLSACSDGFYVYPCTLPGGGLIASFQKKGNDDPFRLYRIDPQTGARLEIIYSKQDWHCVDAQVLSAHSPVKGRSSVANLQKDTGVFFCMNVYDSDIPSIKNLEPGSAKRLRVLEGLPLVQSLPRAPISSTDFGFGGSGSNSYTGTPFSACRIVGVAPVEEDGSFHIEVPAHTPLSFQLLDERGMTIAEQQSWTWAIPNEKRGCIGCHEDREMAPSNLLKKAIIQKARNLILPPERRRMVDFIHEIKPILEAKCSGMGCHTSGNIQPRLDVEKLVEHPGSGAFFSVAYENLLSPMAERNQERYVVPGQAKESPLIWSLLGERMGKTAYSHPITPMPPLDVLSELEINQIIEWIDLGAFYDIRAIAEAADRQEGE